MQYEENKPVLTGQEARSGRISGRVITILVASVVLAVVLLGGATMFWTNSH
ncbi:MAG: hypothetical protein ABWY00_17720 [Dongiaceae bacterium]